MLNLINRRRQLSILLVSVLLIILVSTAALADNKGTGAGNVRVAVQTPPVAAALPLLWMKEQGVLADRVDLEVHISPDHNRAIALISKNEIEMMVTGVNVGAKVFNKGIDVKLLNTNTWAIDYLLTDGFQARGWQDLRGKTLSLPLKGGPLDFLVRYFLQKNGVDPEEVQLVYKPPTNGVRSFQLGRLDAIILPEPMVTLSLAKNKNARLSLDLQQEWARWHDGDGRIPYVGLFVNGQFASRYPQLTRELNNYYQQGVDWVNSHPDAAASLGAEYFGMPEKVIRASFQRINLNCYPEEESYPLIEDYFQEMMKMYPELIGGQLPNEYFYF